MWLQSVDSVLVVGLLLIALGVYLLYRAQKNVNSKIDISDILVDSSLRPPRITLAKFAGVVALFASTYWVTVLVAQKSLTDGIFWGYVTAWAAVKVASDFSNFSEGRKRRFRDYDGVEKEEGEV